MRRKKKLPTRRRRAARCAAAALVLLILAQNFLHTAYLLPIQAVRPMEEQQNLQGTRVVRRQWEPEVHGWTNLFYLTANDRAVLLTGTYLTARGWRPMHTGLLDCTGDRALHAMEAQIRRNSGPGAELRSAAAHCFFWGRVDDPAIETVEISIRADVDYSCGAEEETGAEGERVRLTAPLRQGRDGRRYFLVHYLLEDWPGQGGAQFFAIGRNRTGAAVTELEITQRSAGAYG